MIRCGIKDLTNLTIFWNARTFLSNIFKSNSQNNYNKDGFTVGLIRGQYFMYTNLIQTRPLCLCKFSYVIVNLVTS